MICQPNYRRSQLNGVRFRYQNTRVGRKTVQLIDFNMVRRRHVGYMMLLDLATSPSKLDTGVDDAARLT